ncbi:dephospho-CoA kinase [Salipiger aestuarii]|uniref:Dephospho-CoA kinase n=1 Tax=Salipiger aestuarii TaxID=568098 RepID=A0A327YMB6_9RHOB|nr:dephospho-CoA kinase [Salipiger aestuarii]EIE50060.1 dephospho-CoA kinase [Citreicella sp. 357]KAA8609852.1 dephospho-CoA kinase [Salipiger aestuarii]KAA8616164.1 dephospho-CoA kinase [Salipiger aestuarii]KAB2543112.1 dephospho-CoA kinase [Salipiger aestuarii]RAK21427.1 dephospho-CoA kinase [Salipiger aestuarii]
MLFRLGLTGSIGMGKSTTALMFADEGCAVWDADAAVHRLYAQGGKAVGPIREIFPDAIANNAVSRDRLREIIATDKTALPLIEAVVHPLVGQDREIFAQSCTDLIGVFDIPLLYETGACAEMDAVACVRIPGDEQRRRVLARGTMTAADLERILSRQMPNDEKCARSDYVIDTDTLDHARAQVRAIVRAIKDKIDA